MSGSAPVDLMSMDGLNYFVPAPQVCFVLLVLLVLRCYSRNYNYDIEDLKNFLLACPTSPAGSGKTGKTCIICLEQMQEADPSCKLQCEHEFHPECLFAWWKSKTGRYEGLGRQDPVVRCPTCRQKHKRHEVEQLGDEEMVLGRAFEPIQ